MCVVTFHGSHQRVLLQTLVPIPPLDTQREITFNFLPEVIFKTLLFCFTLPTLNRVSEIWICNTWIYYVPVYFTKN